MSESGGIVYIDIEKELQKIIQRLDKLPDQIAAPNILKNALNATARKVRKQLIKGTKERYALKNENILKKEDEGAPKILTATAASMSAVIRSRGPMQDIMAFMTRPNQETGAAAAQVLTSGGMKPLEAGGLKAFVTTFASGHTAIVQRDPPKQYEDGRGIRAERYGAKADMTKLKKLLSPAVPFMLGNEAVRGEAEALAYKTLQGEIDKQIAKALGKT